MTTYRETFNDGPGGWLQVLGNGNESVRGVAIEDGAAVSRGPWWVDYNHAPPGGGYLQLLFCLHTRHDPAVPASYYAPGGRNRFVADNYPTDFTNARITVRLRGEIELRGAQLLLLAQARVGDRWVNHVLTGQPLQITPQWSEQVITLTPDAAQWKCLGSRHDRLQTYGWGDIADVLRDLNADIIFVLHPIPIVPATPVAEPHLQRAGEDYPLDPESLPTGYLMLHEISIAFDGTF